MLFVQKRVYNFEKLGSNKLINNNKYNKLIKFV